MKIPILAIAASVMMATGAHASTVSVTSSATLPTNPTSPVPTTFTAPVLINQTKTIPLTERSPFEGTKFDGKGLFTSIEGMGSATFNFTSPRTLTELTLIWGSPDKYNKLQIFAGLNGTGKLIATITGNDPGITPFGGPEPHTPTSPGLGYSFVKITGLTSSTGGFKSVRFSNSPQDNAFEISTLSAVPLPAAAPLFGMALALMGGYGFVRRKRPAATPA